MARLNGRRNREVDSDDDIDGTSRESTPISTAPNDRKRFRQSINPDTTTPTSNSRPQTSENTGSSRNTNRRDVPPTSPPKSRHQPGAIVRVKLTNFVTYTAVEFFPGPNLNMVIGPNGTGKSTLVCAICLGLGWGPGLLGRAKDPAEFVKHGCKEATIEIELQRAASGPATTRANPVIVRNIKKDGNKSTFYVNGSPASAKEVLRLARLYNIQVDNLCQFLPQDRVVEFAQMNPVQMLDTTLRAAADPLALEWRNELISIRSRQVELLAANKGDRENLENLEKRQDSQRNEVVRLKERQIVQKQIEWHEKCRPIVDYVMAKRKAAEMAKSMRELKEETRGLETEAGPALEKVNAKQEYAKAAKQNLGNHKKEVKRASDECKRIERIVQTHDQRMTDCDQKHDAEKQSARTATQELGKQRQVLNTLNASKQQEPEPFDSRAMNEEIQEHVRSSRELTQKGEEMQRNFNNINRQGKEWLAKRKELEEQIEKLNTQDGQRESRLEEISRDTSKAWKWIKANQQLFTKEVFGPPAITCSIRDPRMANSVENCLGQGDFKIITVQCMEDFRTLQNELIKKQRLHDISLRTCSVEGLSGFKPPVPDDELSKFGLEQWAIDCIQGPPTVLAMLCGERFLHQTAITSKDVTQEQHDAIENSPIKTYIAGGKSIRFTRRQEYGAAGVTAMVRDIRPARVWTDKPVDAGRQRQLNDQIKQINIELQEAKENRATLNEEMQQCKEERTQEDATIDKLKKEKEAKQKALIAWQNLDTRIEQTQNKIQQYEANIASVRERCYAVLQEKDEAMFQKADAVLKYCGAAHVLRDANVKLLEAEIVAIEAQSDSETLQLMNKTLKDRLELKRKELTNADREHKLAVEEGKKLMGKVRAVKAEAEELAQKHQESGLYDLMQVWTDKDKTLQDYLNEVEALNARLDLTVGGNQNIIKEFEERGKKIEKLQERLRSFNEDQEEFISAIRELRGKYEDELVPVISKIDEAFSESFARIGCAGQVVVHKASSSEAADCTEEQGGLENGLDFENWAIHIYVKFRESEPLSLLDSHRQSGGERAVSTIFYLMALQSLSRSPFRVVDEINQGMDPRNERMVHGRMVDIAAANEKAVAEGQSGGSQYFLITPKLLSGLKYERGMAVLCIVSGENMPSASDVKRTGEDGGVYTEKGKRIDFAAFARRARELGMGQSGAGDGRRVDSGVVMSSRGVPVAG